MVNREPEEIVPGVWLGVCPLPAGWNLDVAVVLARGERLAVIDTGVAEFMPHAIVPALAALGTKLEQVDLIINTHAHWDHVQGNTAIRAASVAPVCIPALEAADLETETGEAGADQLLSDGEILDLGGGLSFEIIVTPGHSPGICCLYERSRRLLIVSDAVQGYGPDGAGVPLYFHSGEQYRTSLQRLAALDIDVLVLGHPFRWSGPALFIQRGDDARRFLVDSQQAATKVASAVQAALGHCAGWGAERDLDCVGRAVLPLLAAEPLFGIRPGQRLSRLAEGTLRSELHDLGT